ncbi:MAG: NlpC/P60 family protein [Terracoccus sp.]
MAHIAPGRHRAPGRFNPLAELTLIAKESAQPAVKGAAIVAASGGLVASFAAPSFAADSGSSVVAAVGTSAAGSAAVGPVASTAQGATALSSVGYATPAAARPVAPIVIEDILVKTQRAQAAAKVKADASAQARVDAAARAQVVATAQAKARAQASAKALADAASQRQASPARASRSTTRAAVTSTPTRSTATRSTTSTAPKSNPAPAPVRAQSASGIAGIAQSLFGIPYVYGGTSTSGFDCSGYTQYVYRRAGISIPRTASAQQNAATRVSSPRPGDLVFFGSPAYHVGIYLGPGRLADEQRPGTVSGNHSIWTTPSGYGRF